MTDRIARIATVLLLINAYVALWQFVGFEAAVSVWVLWYTQSHMYHVVWDGELSDEDGD